MKKIITIFTFAAIFAACNNSSDKMNAQATRDSIKKAITDSLRLDSFQRAEAKAKEKARIDSLAAVKAKASVARSSYASSSGSSARPMVQSDYYEQSQPQKKGWSAAAKGAAIGAGAGAVTGLIVDKKNARGAIIGGVLGAGTGYIIGRQKDKKTGRAQ